MKENTLESCTLVESSGGESPYEVSGVLVGGNIFDS